MRNSEEIHLRSETLVCSQVGSKAQLQIKEIH